MIARIRDDHDDVRAGVDDVACEARANLIAALAIDAPVQHAPIGCSKCRERHDAFVEAGIADPTTCTTTGNLA